MATTLAPSPTVTGGSFLLNEAEPAAVFTPEDFSDEQRQIAGTAAEFAANEVLPAAEEIEAKHFDVTRELLKKAGDLGLMAVDIPRRIRRLGHGQGHLGDYRRPHVSAGQLQRGFQRACGHWYAAHRLVWNRCARRRSICRGWRAASGSRPTRCQRRRRDPTDEHAPARFLMEITTSSTAKRCGSPTLDSPISTRLAKIADPDDPDPAKAKCRRTFSTALLRPDDRRRGAQARHPPDRRRARSSSMTAASRSRTCSARRAKGTTSPSTFSTSGASSWERRA